MVFLVRGEFYRVLSVYKKSYNKWRIEESTSGAVKHWAHLQKILNTFDSVKKKTGPAHEIYVSCDISFLDSGNLQFVLGGRLTT